METQTLAISEEILVVDDVPAICWLLGGYLATKGYRVQTATTARAACELLAATRFALLITDIHLDDRQNRSGLEVVEFARRNQPLTPVIAISGSALPDTLSQLLALGVETFLSKPILLGRLEEAVSKAIRTERLD